MNKSSISIIGTGALGHVLAKAVSEVGYNVKSLYNQTEGKAYKTAQSVGIDKYGNFPHNMDELGKLVFITVPDRQIAKTSSELSGLNTNFKGYTFIHCSGSKTSLALKSLRDKNALVASFHPLQTFTVSSQPDDFNGIVIDLEGDDPAVNQLDSVARNLGAKSMHINAEAKPYLHAAAVMASNNLVGLIESATQIAARGGIEKREAHRALIPLVLKTVYNLASSETTGQALSGPVARGDISTIKKHLELLEQKPELKSLYKRLGSVIAKLAVEEDRINPKEFNEILAYFEV